MKEFLSFGSLILFLATGCGLWFVSAETFVNAEASQKAEAAESIVKEIETEQGQLLLAMPALKNGYYEQKLSAREKELYEIMYRTLAQRAVEAALLEDAEDAELEKVFQCVLNDHPELFYVDGFTVTTLKEDGIIVERLFSGSYLYDAQEIKKRVEAMEKTVQKILKESADCIGEYEKVRYVYEYLVKNTQYVQNAPDNQNICSVLLGGSSVCQGYAKTMQYLLERMGIRAILATGSVDGGQEHVWNIVRIDGAYYHVDVTWGDASYINANANDTNSSDGGRQGSGGAAEAEGQAPRINYEYLCVPDGQLFQTHCPDSVVALPKCASMSANYYVREGLYFEDADMERAKQLFSQAYEEKKEYVTFKCADGQTYQKLKKELIEKQRIFRYLPRLNGKIAYTENEQQLTLSFWLQD